MKSAVVLGGSVAGLLTARVLSRHGYRVTIVERDRVDGGRAGVPQSKHTHVLLTSGLRALEELFPGLTAELVESGGPCLSVPADLGVWQSGRWVSRSHASAPVLTASRPFVEAMIRQKVLEEDEIRVAFGVVATGLRAGAGGICGVALRDRGGDAGRAVHADLVVDATGRGSRLPEWLAALGAEAPAEEVLRTGRVYATCTFEGAEPDFGLRGFYIVPDARQPLGAIILPAETGRWMVTLSGPPGQAPPTDLAGFVAFAAGLPHDAPHRWLTDAQPVNKPVGYRHTENRRRRYDRPRWSQPGLLVVGDALCAFNPVYGQGLSVAALGAVVLDRALREAPSTAHLQRALLRSAAPAWDVAVGADSRMAGASGNARRGGPAHRLLAWYLDRVQARVPADPVVCKAFRDVLFLLAPPSSLLFSGQVLWRSFAAREGRTCARTRASRAVAGSPAGTAS